MAIPSPITYSIIKYKDVYTLTNNTLTSLVITIKQLDCGNPIKEVITYTVPGNTSQVLNFKYDGTFGVYVGNASEPSSVIDIYDNTLCNIIQYTEEILCGCNCAGCDECDDESQCSLTLKLLSMIIAYYIATNPRYNTYFNILASNLKCDITSDLLCQINNISVLGKSDSTFFLKRLIAYYYLIFYIEESLQSTDEEEAIYIKEKFNYLTIKPCIKKLGINPDDIVEEILSGMEVQYWQYNNTVSNINTVILAWTPTYLDTIPGIDSRPLEDFEQGVVVPYTNIGRIGFAISPTQLINFSIVDSLGNDVTDDFDNHYFEEDETVVFVSKVPYSHSNIYFKFKKNIYV